jgi:hypothetical protein
MFAIAIAATMVMTTVFIIFYHDRKHSELDQWVAYSSRGDTLRHALTYYRFMAVSMIVFYVLFTISCLLLQAEGHQIFTHSSEAFFAGPIGTALFAFDLVLRGGFFDVMQHFNLSVTPIQMNRQAPWFVWYAFVFRMFYGLTLMKILFSFIWIYGRIRVSRQMHRENRAQLQLFK